MNPKIVISLISLLVGITLVFVFIVPNWSSIKILRFEVGILEQDVVDLEKLLSETRQIKEKYIQAEEDAKRIFLAIPKQRDLPYLLIQFEALAASNGLLLESIEFSQAEEVSKKKPVQTTTKSQVENTFLKISHINLSLSGSYSAFKNYLVALENNIRSMDVYSIGFAPYGYSDAFGGFASDIFEFTSEIVVYYQ